jgi:hypothetical protein
MNTLQRCCTVLALASTVLITQGCAGWQPRDPRDAPWDPKPGVTLFDQMPNWQYQCGVNVKC